MNYRKQEHAERGNSSSALIYATLPFLVGLFAIACSPAQAQDAECMPEMGTRLSDFEARCPGSNAFNFIFPDLKSEFGDNITQDQIQFLHSYHDEGFLNAFWGLTTTEGEMTTVGIMSDGNIAHPFAEVTVDCESKSASWSYGKARWNNEEVNKYQLAATMPTELLPASIFIACNK